MIRGLFVLGLLILSVHLANVFGGPVIRNKMLQGKMKDVAEDRALRPEVELHKDLMEFIQEKKVPLTESDVVWRKKENGYSIAARYTVTAKFLFYEHTFAFFPASEDEARLKGVKPKTAYGTTRRRR